MANKFSTTKLNCATSSLLVGIPENAFHALTFSGGYIGAWIGQARFHHKISKKSFQIKHYAVCLLSVGIYTLMAYFIF